MLVGRVRSARSERTQRLVRTEPCPTAPLLRCPNTGCSQGGRYKGQQLSILWGMCIHTLHASYGQTLFILSQTLKRLSLLYSNVARTFKPTNILVPQFNAARTSYFWSWLWRECVHDNKSYLQYPRPCHMHTRRNALNKDEQGGHLANYSSLLRRQTCHSYKGTFMEGNSPCQQVADLGP